MSQSMTLRMGWCQRAAGRRRGLSGIAHTGTATASDMFKWGDCIGKNRHRQPDALVQVLVTAQASWCCTVVEQSLPPPAAGVGRALPALMVGRATHLVEGCASERLLGRQTSTTAPLVIHLLVV